MLSALRKSPVNLSQPEFAQAKSWACKSVQTCFPLASLPRRRSLSQSISRRRCLRNYTTARMSLRCRGWLMKAKSENDRLSFRSPWSFADGSLNCRWWTMNVGSIETFAPMFKKSFEFWGVSLHGQHVACLCPHQGQWCESAGTSSLKERTCERQIGVFRKRRSCFAIYIYICTHIYIYIYMYVCMYVCIDRYLQVGR